MDYRVHMKATRDMLILRQLHSTLRQSHSQTLSPMARNTLESNSRQFYSQVGT